MESVETQAEKCSTEVNGTQTEPCPTEDINTQTKQHCVCSIETQTYTLVDSIDVVVQTDFEENVHANHCIFKETVENDVQNDSMPTHDNEAQTEKTPLYTPLVREVVILKLQHELTQTQQVFAQYKKEVVPLQIHQELMKKFNTLTAT